MICPKCEKKMTCVDTYCRGVTTIRRIKCSKCGIVVYTKETAISENLGKKMFAEKRDKYRKREQTNENSL